MYCYSAKRLKKKQKQIIITMSKKIIIIFSVFVLFYISTVNARPQEDYTQYQEYNTVNEEENDTEKKEDEIDEEVCTNLLILNIMWNFYCDAIYSQSTCV